MFTLGFQKTADMSRHSDGTEFKVGDTEPTPYVAGAGGMSPSGIATYQPSGAKNNDGSTTGVPWAPQKSAKAAEKERAIRVAMLGKMGSKKKPRSYILNGSGWQYPVHDKIRTEKHFDAASKAWSTEGKPGWEKMGSVGDARDSGAYVGAQGQTASTVASQLKYETTGDNLDNIGRINLDDTKKRMKRARK